MKLVVLELVNELKARLAELALAVFDAVVSSFHEEAPTGESFLAGKILSGSTFLEKGIRLGALSTAGRARDGQQQQTDD